jgi:4-amino-4-deoxy-L-arabinose transferase-like glycosyltransferase
MDSEKIRKYLPWIAALFILLVYIAPLGSYHLMEPDEGRYAEIPREMMETGNYVTPMLDYVKYFEKPAMLYWMNALSFHVFGQNEFAARFPSALCGLLGVLTTGLLAASVFGFWSGLIAAVVTATSLLYFAVSSINITDMPLTFFLTLAMAAFYMGHTRRDKRWYLLFYVAMALGLLTKGLVAIVLPGGIIFWYVVFTRQWRTLLEVLYIPGIILFFVLSVPWFYLVCKANPDFFWFFFIHEHFLRYATKIHGRYEPFWFFLPLIPAGLMPWTGCLFALAGKKSVLRAPENAAARDANIFLLLWFGIILLFFSLSDSKLIPYIAPCIPPLAIMIGADLARMLETGELHGGAVLWTSGIAVLFSAALIIYSFVGGKIAFSDAFPIALKLSGGLLIGPAVGIWCLRGGRRKTEAAFAAMCLSALLFTYGLHGIETVIDRSTYDVSQVIIKERQPGDTIATGGEVLQAVPFYTKQRVMLVDYYGELEFGGRQKEGKGWFLTGPEFLRQWRSGRRLIFVVEKERMANYFPDGKTGADKTIDCGKYNVLIKRKAD